MNTICKLVGAVVLILYVLAWLDVVDFYLCIGKPGSCVNRDASADLVAASQRGAE